MSGRERWRQERLDYLAYPPTEIHYMRPVARTVTFASNNSVYVIPPSPPPQEPQQQQQSPPEPQQPQTPPQREPEQHQHHDARQSQPPQPEQEAPAPAQTQDAPPQAEPKPPKGPKRGGKKKQSGRVRFGPEPPPPQQQEQEQPQEEHAQGHGSGGDAPGQQGPHSAAPAPGPVQQGQPGYLLRYTPSPLPRWEATPRRHEYFSGEYRSYYPTPVREGIYRIATDANRLTTIFSEENPNACTIV
ncbi:hypothetical protein BS78_04G252100 [Paspalum vaginatum]|nr:hypothetical protein BS78_04G252100 [Paspalum vaginatum]